MRVIDLSVVENLIREALPRATDEDVTFLVARCEGRSIHPDNEDLLGPSRAGTRRTTASSGSGCLSAAS